MSREAFTKCTIFLRHLFTWTISVDVMMRNYHLYMRVTFHKSLIFQTLKKPYCCSDNKKFKTYQFSPDFHLCRCQLLPNSLWIQKWRGRVLPKSFDLRILADPEHISYSLVKSGYSKPKFPLKCYQYIRAEFPDSREEFTQKVAIQMNLLRKYLSFLILVLSSSDVINLSFFCAVS